jgi:hypothetical protein
MNPPRARRAVPASQNNSVPQSGAVTTAITMAMNTGADIKRFLCWTPHIAIVKGGFNWLP